MQRTWTWLQNNPRNTSPCSFPSFFLNLVHRVHVFFISASSLNTCLCFKLFHGPFMTNVQNKTLHFPSSRVEGEAGATSFPYSALPSYNTVQQGFIVFPCYVVPDFCLNMLFPNTVLFAPCPCALNFCGLNCFSQVCCSAFFPSWIHFWCLSLPPVSLQQWSAVVTKGKKLQFKLVLLQ